MRRIFFDIEEKDAEKGNQEREEIGQIVSIEELLRVFLKRSQLNSCSILALKSKKYLNYEIVYNIYRCVPIFSFMFLFYCIVTF